MTILRRTLTSMAVSVALAGPVWSAPFTLTGDYIKIGVNEVGTIGSNGNTNPGIQYDNTGTRTFNSSYDYLTPGSPFEGFTVKYTDSSGTVVSKTNNNASYTSPQITGSLTNYSGTAYLGETFDNRGVWAGTSTDFGITNDVRFNNTWKYVDIKTMITATNNMTNLYFARFTDPDARAASGDSSRTTNTLGFSPISASNVVFSEALVSKYALGLYSAASNVGAGISSSWSTDPLTYYTGTNGGDGDYTIGLAFLVPTLNAGEIATFQYAYIFGPSTLDAGSTAVSAGAGGGTAGVVPGCTTSCTMPGVTSSTPTITSTTTDYILGRLSVFQRVAGSGTLGIRNTITSTSTPVTTDTYSDSSTVTTTGTTTSTETLTNYSTRTDQYDKLTQVNSRTNQTLDSGVYDRHEAKGNFLVPRTSVYGDENKGYFYGSAQDMRGSLSDNYTQTGTRLGFGYERLMKPNWIVGAQYNNVSLRLTGTDSAGSLIKDHVGVYSLYTKNGWVVKTDAGVAFNKYAGSHSLNGIEELGPLSNTGSTKGTDYWISNRVYAPGIAGFKPYIGARVDQTQIGQVNEQGSTLTAQAHDAQKSFKSGAEAGVRYDRKILNDKVNLTAEVGTNSYGVTTYKAGASYTPKENVTGGISVGQVAQAGTRSNLIQAEIKWQF